MQQPFVSIVIPVYNGSDYLNEAIDSVLNQTYENIEILVVNDGSSDEGKTEKIALSYGDKIRYFKKENGGVASALNEGILHMRGEYFSWLSHDDVFYPDKVEKQMQMILENQVKITACAYNIFMDSGRKIPVPIIDFYGKENLEKSVFSVINAMIQFGGVLIHQSIFQDYGTFRKDLRTTQDYEFLFRILRKERCIYSNERLYGIRYHENQGSNTIKSVDRDRDEMYLMFLQELTEEEKVLMYGSVYNFYYQMLLRIVPIPYMAISLKSCIEGLVWSGKQENGYQKNGDSREENETYWIYGAGAYGKRLLFDLRCRNMDAAGFIDGNKSIQGTMIDGIECVTLEQFRQEGKNGQIIIASLYREEIAENLRRSGVENFLYKEEFDRKMILSPPDWKRVKKNVEKYKKNGWISNT